MDYSQIQATIAELRAELQRQRDEIVSLRSRQPTKPRPSLPDPEKFGGQAHKFDTWLPSIKAKLRVDGEAIGDTVAQFYYVYLNLDSHVQAMVLPQLGQAEVVEYWNYQTILDQLARVYDNPNKVYEAEDKLMALRQGTDSIPVYIAKFERLLYEANGQDWPDTNKISTFRNGLGSTVRNRLAQQLNLPRSYVAFLRIVQQLSSRFSSSTTFPSNSERNGHGHQHSDPMDLNVVSLNAIDISPSTPRSILKPPRARSTSPAQRQEYKKQGNCLRCGSDNHWVQDCFFRPHSPGAQAHKIDTSRPLEISEEDMKILWEEEQRENR